MLIGCIKNLKVDEKTKEVVYIIPEAVHKFLTLYTNISDCLMGNLSLNIDTGVSIMSSSCMSMTVEADISLFSRIFAES